MLTQRLIDQSAKANFEQNIVNPEAAARNLFLQLDLGGFSSVVDLSGFFGEQLQRLFPELSIMTEFRLSRMRVVSSPRLDGSGFRISIDDGRRKELQDNFDLTNPLLIDDVSWSGRTIIQAIKTLGIDPSSTTVGLLASNDGVFGENKPGSKQTLENAGITVVSGCSVFTPNDDGFHLTDFCNFENDIGDAFDVVLEIQRLREVMVETPELRQPIESKIKAILAENRELLFPNALSSERMSQMTADGTFIPIDGVQKNAFFDSNPPNWLMPSFSKRTNWITLQRNRDSIVSTIGELKALNDDPEGKRETSLELKTENQTAIPDPEGQISRGKERL